MDNNTTTYEQEIDLKDLMFAVLYKWRPIIIIAIIFGVLLGGYKLTGSMAQQRDTEYVKKAQKQYQQDFEEYEALKASCEREIKNIERNIESQTEYLEKSILMKISPFDKYISSADIFIKSDDVTLVNGLNSYTAIYNNGLVRTYASYINQGFDLSKLAAKMGTEEVYLKELITVKVDEWGQMLSVSVCYSDETGAERILNAILDDVKAQYDDYSNKFGAHELYIMNQVSSTTTDLELDNKQKMVNDNITTLQTTLKEKEKTLEDMQEPVESAVLSTSAAIKSGIKYAVLGGVLGAFITIFCICVAFLMTNKIISAKDLKQRYGVKILAVFPGTEKKRLFSGIDRWLEKLEGKKDHLTEEARYELMAANLKNYAGEAKNILVVGTVSTEILKTVVDKLGKLCSDMTLTIGNNLNESAETVSKLPDCEAVILVEQCGVSRLGEIEKEIEAVRNVKKEIAGVVVF
ncbi:MAG: chain-length determining protein [Hungatella hathewayi]|nr:chain-length determining protein [Hungatella hathewayi]